MAAAYEFAAAQWGWTADRVEGELSHELFVLYLDAAVDWVEAKHASGIEVVRAGTIFAHDSKAHQKWTRKRHRGPGTHVGRGLIGDALEAAVSGIAALFPGNVVRGTA